MMLSVAPLLVWAWLNSENEPQKPNIDEEKQAENTPAVVAPKKVRAKKTKMSRNQAFQVLIEHGFQPQIPTKKIPKVEIYAQDSIDLPLKRITLGTVNKKPTLIHFWATWCGPCKLEMPHFAKYVRSQDTFDVFTITPELKDGKDIDFKKIWNFYKSYNLKGLNACSDSSGGLGNFLNVSGIPVTFVISADGILFGSFLGATDWANDELGDALEDYMDTSSK
ncbi:MAG: TlpA disulfide reductase family protein [Proteobacteria bacterium]|nr:TlpA disulfide reductase family protein [Pseudomonadota bacterium]